MQLALQQGPVTMNIIRIVTFILLFVPVLNVQAQENYGGEIVTFNTFGEGMMVTRARMVPLSGTVTNMFFFNRVDEPWNGNEWYEYDWEIRGARPFAGWSQIRVREQGETKLEDAPESVETTTNLSDELVHYVLIRKDDLYVYDIRRDFNVSTYNYRNAAAHGGNSVSLLSDGPRVYETGGKVAHIPQWKELDFSLGITAFDNAWAGRLPNGDYSREAEVDFARFYTFTGTTLNTTPEWSDEFIGSSLDFGKWYVADWSFRATQFRPQNVRVQDGRLFLRINRGESFWDPAASGITADPVLIDADLQVTQSLPEVQVTDTPEDTALGNAADPVSSDTESQPVISLSEVQVTNVPAEAPIINTSSTSTVEPILTNTETQATTSAPEIQVTEIPAVATTSNTVSPTLSDNESQSTLPLPEVQVAGNPAGDSNSASVADKSEVSVQAGSADLMTLWMLAACGFLAARRRRNQA